MALRRICEKFFDGVVFVQKKITGTLLLVMIFAVSWQIVGRVLLKMNTPWTEELAKLCLIWFTFLGSIGVLYKGEHLTVDLLLARYKDEMRKRVSVFIYAVISAFCIMMFVFGIGLCRNPIIRRGVTTGLNISRLWLYLSLPISMFFSSLIAVYKFITSIADLVKGGGKA
ncbi:MAG: TRAP transporter small permease [Clostridia bacterium]|nr:TRAP transporter small permease [Clostridia bacterium]